MKIDKSTCLYREIQVFEHSDSLCEFEFDGLDICCVTFVILRRVCL